ncbi:MAG: cellulase family glycosylhydrolase [Clostridia bacterium]|nr:cellulase family glycosylhydrolase [Clostridia bacterium]
MSKKSFLSRISVFLLILILLGCSVFTGCNKKPDETIIPEDVGENYPGLFVADDGYIYLNGKKFYGYGLCMFSTFQDALAKARSIGLYTYDHSLKRSEAYIADLRFCNMYDIPVIRVPFCGWGVEVYKKFQKAPNEVFRIMDKVVAAAEEHHVGIIVSLLWNQDTVPFLVGEKRSAFGDRNSKTIAFAKEYVSAIVSRYKDSPAIWGWEIGNEYNLSCDLHAKPTDIFMADKFSYFDYYASDELVVFYEEVAKTIREIDKTRLITTGNGENRNFSYAGHIASSQRDEFHYWEVDWSTDTREQFMEMCAYFTPDPIDTICFHFQHGTLNAAEGSADIRMTHTLKDEVLTTADYVKVYVEAGRKVKKGVYFGEFGDYIDVETESRSDFDRTRFEENFKILMDGMVAADLQLATGWFNWSNDNGRFNHTQYDLSDVNVYKMNMLKEINDRFVAEGKQDIEAYWAKYPCDGSSFMTSEDSEAPDETAVSEGN